MTLDEQDGVGQQILDLWPEAKVVDRRTHPNNGYRALHLVPRVDGCWVEIQIRTFYQDTWAQLMEQLADQWGRSIRYGGLPDRPDEPIGPPPAEPGTTRAEFVQLWVAVSQRVAQLEHLENRRAQVLNVLTEQELRDIDEQIDSVFGGLREAMRGIRQDLGLVT